MASPQGSQWIAVFVLSVVLCGATVVLHHSDSQLFERFFGHLNPLLAVSLVALVGAATLAVLRSQHCFEIWKRHSGRLPVRLAAVTTLFTGAAIALDLAVGFPEDTNVLLPASLLFYPVMAYVVEVVFHLVPLMFLLLGARLLGLRPEHNATVWVCVVVVAALEPGFQLLTFAWDAPWWAEAYLGLHIFGINLIQLWIFKRYDFASMLAFRLLYYLQWHIVWGYARLQIAF